MTLLELGAVILGLAVLARVATRFDLPTAPLYLLAGLAFGEGGIVPLVTTEHFVETGAEIGLILLLFVLGLEHSSRDLIATARRSGSGGVLDLVLNAPRGRSPRWRSDGGPSPPRSWPGSPTSRRPASPPSCSSTQDRTLGTPAGS
jgi:hypothetical protein